MKGYGYKGSAVGVALLLALAACGTDPVEQDQWVSLQAGQGLMAVEMDSLDPLTHVTIEALGRVSGKIDIRNVPAGLSIYLYPVAAGRYCLTGFQYFQWKMAGKGAELGCFDVPAGGLGYSGRFAPRVEGGRAVSHQINDPAGFRALLKQRFPLVAREFPAP